MPPGCLPGEVYKHILAEAPGQIQDMVQELRFELSSWLLVSVFMSGVSPSHIAHLHV